MMTYIIAEILIFSGIVYAVSTFSVVAENLVMFTIPFLLGLALPLYAALKVRARNQTTNDLDDIDHEVLERAEKEVAKMDKRAELSKNHECIAKFDSFEGYDQNVMATFIAKFREKNISADYIFIQTLPTGYASYMGGTGIYEFFVESTKREEAESLMAQILNS